MTVTLLSSSFASKNCRTLRAAGASAIAYLRLADEYCTTSCMPPDQICVRTSRDRPAGSIYIIKVGWIRPD